MGTENLLPSGKLLGTSGLVIAFSTLMWSQIETARSQANTAVEVAAQHGQELNDLRTAQREIWAEVARLQAQAQVGGRFTSEDGDKLEARLDRLRARIERIEDRNRAPPLTGHNRGEM